MKNLNEADILNRLHLTRANGEVTHEDVINPDYEIWGRAREWHYHQGVCLLAGLSPVSKPYFDIIINQKSPFDLVHWIAYYPAEATDLTRLRNVHQLLQQVPQIFNTKKHGYTIPPKALIDLCKDILDTSQLPLTNLVKVISKFGPHSSLSLPNTFCSLEIDPAALESLKKFKEREKMPMALNSVIKEDSPYTLPYPPLPSEAPLSIAKRLFPLKGIPRLEKADVINANEIILLHYGIDPERIYENHLPGKTFDDAYKEFIDYLDRYCFSDRQWFVNQLDERKLGDLLQRSIHAGSIKPPDQNMFLKAEIVEWMASKGLAFPLQANPNDSTEKRELSKEDILNYELKRFDKDQLAKLMTRCGAAILWKDFKLDSTQKIRNNTHFKKTLAAIQEIRGKKEPFDDKTIEDWIRNLNPNYKPQK